MNARIRVCAPRLASHRGQSGLDVARQGIVCQDNAAVCGVRSVSRPWATNQEPFPCTGRLRIVSRTELDSPVTEATHPPSLCWVPPDGRQQSDTFQSFSKAELNDGAQGLLRGWHGRAVGRAVTLRSASPRGQIQPGPKARERRPKNARPPNTARSGRRPATSR